MNQMMMENIGMMGNMGMNIFIPNMDMNMLMQNNGMNMNQMNLNNSELTIDDFF